MMRAAAERGSVKSVRVAYGLLLVLGLLGAHRFYVGRKRTGVAILLLTLAGVVGFSPAVLAAVAWMLVDAFLIPSWIRQCNGTAGLPVDRSRVWRALRWGGGALGAGLAALLLLAAVVPKPEPAPEAAAEGVARESVAPRPSSATVNAPWKTAVVAAPEPPRKSPEERIAEILSRPDEPEVQEPWSDALNRRHAEMRGLYRGFLVFRDSAEFRRFGFGAGGPYGTWMQAVLRLNRDREYASRLYDRCEILPDDLWRHARDHMNGRSGSQVRADATAWAACFPD